MRKLLLIACLLLTAVGMRAAKTPQVLWSEDNKTLYFINSETDYHGKAYNGYTVTKLCSGTQVTASGTNNPGWNPYRKNVKNIVFDASFADVRPTSCYSWFYDMENLVSITGIEYLNTSQVTNMAYMFNNCSKLKTLDLTHFDVSNVTTMVRMFQNSSALTTIMSNDDWYSEKVVSSTNMFGNCTSLVGAVAYSDDNSNNILYANPFTGYFSGELVPMVIYCEDNTTLYFTKCAKTIQPGKKYNGHTVTSLWKDADVTDSGQNARGLWTDEKNTTNVVIEPSFADVLPTSCAGWFVGLANLASITGLEYLNTSEVTTMSSMFSGCEALTSLDLKNFNTSKVKSMYAMFQRCDGLTSLDLTNFDTSEVTNMQYMFYGCSGLTSIDLTNVNTSKVTSMNSMFQNCQNLTSIDLTNFDTSKVTNMQYLFCGCSSLTSLDLTNFNMQNASLINSMFKECSALKTIYCDDDWKTNTINNSADLFLDCTSLVGAVAYDAKNKNDVTFANPTTGYFTTIHQVVWCDGNKTLYFISKAKTIAAGDTYNGQTVTAAWSDTEVTATGTTEPGWTAYSENVENVVFDATFVRAHPTSCAQWFTNMSHLTSITGLEYLNTSEVTTMNSMFGECRALTSLDVKTFDTQNVTDMSRLFSGCAALKTLDLTKFDMKKVTEMASMFADCKNLTTIYCNDDWNTETVTSSDNMFTGCTNLVGAVAFNADNANDVTFANPETGYFFFTGERIPTVIFCQKSRTLYFINATKAYAIDDTYKGQTVTDVWAGTLVTETGAENPGWKIVNNLAESVIIDKSFADVRPTSCYAWFEQLGSMVTTITGLEYLNTSEVTNMARMFLKSSGLTSLDLRHFDTKNVTDMYWMFNECSSLKTLDVSKFNTSKVTNMYGMFAGCKPLTGLDLSSFDTQNVTDMAYMFADCEHLPSLDLSKFNTSKVTNMREMFRSCEGLTTLDVSSFDTQNVTDMFNMFYMCYNVEALDVSGFNTSNVTSMKQMFHGCLHMKSLDPSKFDTQNVTDMSNMFVSCAGLTSLDLTNWDTQKVTDMNNMFAGCTGLTSLDLSNWNVQNVTDFTEMFINCTKLQTIYCNYDWDTRKVANSGKMFDGCEKLVGAVAYDAKNDNDVTFANPETGYFTFNGERIPSVIWCKDNGTLYFTNAIKTYAEGDTFKGQKVTDVWSGTEVTASGTSAPNWVLKKDDISSIIIDKTFADVRPTSCRSWFEKMKAPITGLEFLNTSEVTTMSHMFYLYKGMESLDLSTFDTRNVTDMNSMFASYNSLKSIDLSKFNTSKVTDMTTMFLKCDGLESLDLSAFDTRNVTSMSQMFMDCSNLKNLNLSKFNTSKVTNMGGMFMNCGNLTSLDLSAFDTQNVTNMSSMFDGCSKLTSLDLSMFNTSKVTNMTTMFNDCFALTSLDVTGFDTQNVTSMRDMFQYCRSLTSLDLSNFNTSKVTDMYRMFNQCKGLTNLNVSGFDTKNVTDMHAMFGSCHNLTTIDLSNFNTSKVTDMGGLFYTCNSLTSLDLTSFDTRNVKNMNNMFLACSDLTTIYCNDDWNTGTVTSSEDMFASCTNLVGAVAYSANNAKDVTFANPETGYFTFTGERIPNVIWCEGNRTLYFINATKAYAAGDTYKGQTVSGSWSGKLVTDTGADFPGWHYTRDLVYSVIIDENFYDVHPTSCQAWFDEMREVSEIKGLEHLNTSEVTNMRRMFIACHGLKSLNLKFFNTSKVTDMAYMFYECYSLTSLDVSGFDTQNVTDMSGMFQGCTGLTSLDITNFDTSKVTNMSFMLSDLGGLSSLNLTKFSTASATEMYAMFEGCTSLTTIFCDDDWSKGIVTSSTRMFNKCINLSGAVAYNSKNANDITLANPKGYFTTTIHIELKDGEDNSAILDEYNGKVVSVNYDRVLKAIDNGDGTWTSKAYTVCLPYDCNLMKEVRMGQILVCKLWYIKDNKEFLFSNTEPGIKAGIPYLIVVKEGEISLNAEKVVITNQVDEGEEVSEWDTLWPNVLGRWKGTYHRMYDEECESQNIYGMQSDGRWERYYVTKHGPKWCWIETFRGYFQADESTGNNTYKPVYKQYVQGDDEDDPIIDFPAGAFDGDNIDDETTGIMHVIEANGEHHYFDLQGRPLNSKPAKGVYIDNGKKIIQK